MINYKIILMLIATSALLCSCDNGTFPTREMPPAIQTPDVEAEYENTLLTEVAHTDLEGFWHSAPDFFSGEKESYEFFGDGWQVFYKDGKNGFFSGEWWQIKDDGNLELILNRNEQDFEDKVYMTQQSNIEYISTDELTGNPALLIDSQKFWQMNKPLDIIDGSPLYINLDVNFKITDYQNRNAIRYSDFDSEYSEHIIIYCDTDLYDFRICSLNYEDVDGYFNFYFNDTIVSLEKLTSEHYIEYTTTTAEGIPFEAITFRDSNGTIHSYLLAYNGRDGSTCAFKAEVYEPEAELMPPPENTTWAEAYADFFMQNNNLSQFILFDADFDNIPELFFFTPGYGANMWVTTILKFSENEIKQIVLEEEIPAQFKLYKDKQTGEMRWMTVMDSFRSSFSHYNYEWKWIDFSDFPSISTEFFFKWDLEAVVTDSETNKYEEYYYLFENENEMTEVKYEEIESHANKLFSRYELIETQQLYASADDFAINEGDAADVENIKRKTIIEFLLQMKYAL